MNGLEDFDLHCPYCGEPQSLRVELEMAGDIFIEDCRVCCRPMVLRLIGEGGWRLEVRREDDP